MVTEDQSGKYSIEALKNQLETLMNSLAVLSAEKSRMESNFQTEKKQLRNEREEVKFRIGRVIVSVLIFTM